MNTTENNKLIAEFIGTDVTVDMYYLETSKRYVNKNDLKFHSDWNWLMQVVEKIESLEDNNHLMDCFKQSNKVCGLPIYTKIDKVYNACIEFIKWYNEQNFAQKN